MKIQQMIAATLLALFLPIMGHAQKVQDENQQPNLTNLLNKIHDLSSKDFEGRLSGTRGYDMAAEYVIDELKSYGVQPYQGDWTQYFQIECNQIENCAFNTYYNASDTRTRYVLGNDFCCAGMTGRGYADAPVVFCGYGIDAAAYDEYEKVDAQGKIVVVLSGVPSFLPSTISNNYQTLRDKARVALKHGACALVVINTSKSCTPFEVQGKVYNGELPHLATFPIIQPTLYCGEKLFEGERVSLKDAMDSLKNSMKPCSFHLRKHFEIEVNAKYHPAAITENIIGIYPGADKKLANEYIVVGAHLDHLGMQGNTCIFPGADDNASGVAVLLETARMLQNAYPQPRRSVVFVLFSGAEYQHLGSQIFVSNFNPLKRIEAFVNIEAVGTGDSIVAIGNNQFPSLYRVAANMDSAFTAGTLARGIKTNCKGDGLVFGKVGIPTLTFSNLNGSQHNHVPSDIPENIDREFLMKAAKLVYETVYELTFGDYQGRSNASRKLRFE